MRLTKESIELLVENIIDAVEYNVNANRDEQFVAVKQVLLDEGIIEEISD